jgi:hypothetical protein
VSLAVITVLLGITVALSLRATRKAPPPITT